MNINPLFGGTSSSLLGTSTTASQATASSSGVSPFLTQADNRIQAQVDTTTAQISKFGQVQSALSDGQTAAKAMEALTGSSTDADLITALGNFFNTFNTFNTSITAAGAASTSTEFGSESVRATRLVQDLKSALSADPAIADDMKKLGLSIQPDGSLIQDPKKFAAALAADPQGTRTAMAKVGAKVDSVTTNELSSSGTVGSALASLNAQSTTLAAQQSALKSLEQTMASISASDPFTSTDTSPQSSPSSSLYGSALAAYQSNSSGYW